VSYDEVFRAAPVALALVRAHDLVVVDANQAYLDLVGLSADEVLGRPV
jgi:PAS domain-containing protein